ncbi:TPA: hypothetical protein ACX6SL_000718 [Photobacterium damselae]
MKKYYVNCSNCGLNISMLLPVRPSKCPGCREYFGFHDVDDGDQDNYGIRISDSFACGGKKYIHAEGECSVETHNDVVMEVDTVVTAIKGAKVEMNNPTIDKKPELPKALDYKGIKISPPKVFILQTIVNDVIGVEQTLTMTYGEIRTFFRVVMNRVYNGLVVGLNGGALTGIRRLFSDGHQVIDIIDTDDQLTDEGIELLQFIAARSY